VVEPLITMAKIDSVAKRRLAFSRLRDDAVVIKLFTDLGPHYKTRPGGYLRILRHGLRPGDSAPMAVVQLVDRAEMPAPARIKPEKAEKPAKAAKADKPAKAEKPAKAAKAEKAPKAEKAEKKPAAKKAAKKADK